MATYNSLHNKVAIVTGAAQGIGEFIARELAQNGTSVVLTDVQMLVSLPHGPRRASSKRAKLYCSVLYAMLTRLLGNE